MCVFWNWSINPWWSLASLALSWPKSLFINVRATLHPDAPTALELSIALTEGSWTLASPHLILSWVGYPAGQRVSTNAKRVASNKWGKLHLRRVLCNRASTIQTQLMEAVEGSQVGVRDERSEIGIWGAKDLTDTLANSRSARRLGKRIFCDNKAKEIPSTLSTQYILRVTIVGWQSDVTESDSAYDTNTTQSWVQMMKEWRAWEWWIR